MSAVILTASRKRVRLQLDRGVNRTGQAVLGVHRVHLNAAPNSPS